jgi:hypothetical protein
MTALLLGIAVAGLMFGAWAIGAARAWPATSAAAARSSADPRHAEEAPPV